MVTFQVTKEMDLEEWKDHVLGSGAFTWPWWKSVEEVNDGILVEWYTELDYSEEFTGEHCTWQELANYASTLARKNKFVAKQLANDDFDADGMDRVLQYAFMGEVIYG